MFRHIPNAITGSRLVLAVIFFVMLSYFQYQVPASVWYLNVAFLIYLLALFTDFLDGYLARKWKVEGAFGRIVDPFVDKVLVLGSFIFFAGRNFIIPQGGELYVRTISGVTPAMVVVILARELLVTTLRSAHEGGGQAFGAAFSGKVKMVAQSFTILSILVYVNYLPALTAHHAEPVTRYIRDAFIWATIVITIFSGLLYVRRSVLMYGH
jgi:CDP-diacylglycerol--glycerol-3-phosphate 3-phosphatidyltransferase